MTYLGSAFPFLDYEKAVLTVVRDSLSESLGPETKIYLFGSRARRDHRPDSDFDILCLLPDNLDRGTDWNRIAEGVQAAAEAVKPGAEVNIQLLADSLLEDAYFEMPFLPGALRDSVDITEIIGCERPHIPAWRNR